MLCCVIFISFLISPSLSARILGIVPIPSYSHQIAFRPIWRELSLRGHHITLITPTPMNNSVLTNLAEIDVGFISNEVWSKWYYKFNTSTTGPLAFFDVSIELSGELIDKQLQHPEVQALIKNESEHFDLLMVESFYPGMFAFAERFKCPWIGMFSLDALSDIYEAIGNPTHPILYRDDMLPHSGDLTFFERVTNTIHYLAEKYYLTAYTYSSQQLLVNKHFGNDYPSLYDILKNLSMLFVNTDPIFHQIRSHLPTVVQFGGGTHLSYPKPLPKDLQELLDSASQGFILFSFGSHSGRCRELSENTLRVIMETFTELPYLVLWKCELDHLARKPDNVIVSRWLPQQYILRHPNIKIFITHGGLQSMEEAVYSSVPLIGMPFSADQPANVKKFVSKGFGLSVDFRALDKTSFKSKILEVITNPKYRNRIKELVGLVKDNRWQGWSEPFGGLNTF